MANHSLRLLAYDIQKDLKQAIDDKEISLTSVAFWIITTANRIKSQQIEKRDSGAFIHTFPAVPVIRPTANGTDIVRNRPYIVLPKSVYDYDQDGGIKYIGYEYDENEGCEGCAPRYTSVPFIRTMAGGKAARLYLTEYEKPSPKNPYYYRTGGDNVILLGIENTTIETVEVALYSVIDPVTTIDIDAPFDFPEELLPILKRQVLDLGRFVLMVPSERVNDGDNDIQGNAVPTQKLVSVNDAYNTNNQPAQ